jgi:hypothetical protein
MAATLSSLERIAFMFTAIEAHDERTSWDFR